MAWRYKRNAKHPVIHTGLYSKIDRWDIDGRTRIGRALNQARAGIGELFPRGPDAAASLLIDRLIFKALRLSIYERMALNDAEGLTPEHEDRYLKMSNSLREDIRLLSTLIDRQVPEKTIPDLETYLNNLKSAAVNSEGQE